MRKNNISKERDLRIAKVKAIFLVLLASTIALTFAVYAVYENDLVNSIVLIMIALVLLVTFGFYALRRYKDARKGLVSEDERSRRVMERAAARTFFVSIYLLLLVGWLSEDIIDFRDISQATGIVIGIMALLFFGFWTYFNRKEI